MDILIQPFRTYSNLALVTMGLAALMAGVSITYGVLHWIKPTQGLPKIGSRIRFLWIMLGVFILAALYTPKILILYLAFIAFLALKEYLSITPTRRADRRVLFWAYLSVLIQFFFIWMDWQRAFTLFVPVYVFLILPMIMVIIGEVDGFLRAWSLIGWGLISTVLTLGYLAYLVVLPPLSDAPAGGLGLFLFWVALAQISHAAHYFFGKRFNHPKLSLKVSTTRNWASLVGSLLVAAPLAWLIGPTITPFSQWEAFLMGLLIAAGSFVGYIIISAIKNDLRLKDRGSMTPGQGGVLNRIDTYIYTAPLYFYIVSQWYY